MNASILVVTTNHDSMEGGKRTGVWLEEFVVPWELFREAGARVTVATPEGGDVPIDPRSLPHVDTSAHGDALETLLGTTRLEDIDPGEFDALFFPGGHGPMYDLASNETVGRLVRSFLEEDKVVAAVCHGPAALASARLEGGGSAIEGRSVTAFSNTEEEQTGLQETMPFLLESRLRELGAEVTCAAPWAEKVVVDGKLITGQNPASSEGVAKAVLEALQ